MATPKPSITNCPYLLCLLLVSVYFRVVLVLSFLCSGHVIKVAIAPGFHLFPFRTEKLSPATPMVLRNSGRVGSRRFFSSGGSSGSETVRNLSLFIPGRRMRGWKRRYYGGEDGRMRKGICGEHNCWSEDFFEQKVEC